MTPAPLNSSSTAPRIALLLALATVAALFPFAGKAFHIDDPIFLWPARQIADGNSRPLAATVNWYGVSDSLLAITNHPLVLPSVLALVGKIAGFSEQAMHLTLLPFALGAVLGTFLLARRLTSRAGLAAVLLLTSPAFFVSATSIMSDVPMLCLWVWSVVAWQAATDRDRPALYLLAGVALSAAVMTKYPALSAVLLLATQIHRRHLLMQLICLSLPIVALTIWQVFTAHQYGRGAISFALDYAAGSHRWTQVGSQLISGLSFVGGSFPAAAAILLASGNLQRRVAMLVAAGIVALLIIAFPRALVPLESSAEAHRLLVMAHAIPFSIAGAIIVVAAGHELLTRRDRAAMLTGLWILGVLVFATLINWTINARSILPMAPAVAVLCAGALPAVDRRWTGALLSFAIAGSAALALSLAGADMQIANASRTAVSVVVRRARTFHGTLWFTGHWGFQWYMESAGGAPVDIDRSLLLAGDLLVEPLRNTNLIAMPPGTLQQLDAISLPISAWVSPQLNWSGPSFYASAAGPIPYVFGAAAPQRFVVSRVIQNILPPDKPGGS